MERHSKIKSPRKAINPVFHLQREDENDKYLTRDIIKKVRNTGQLNLSSKHLSSVPAKMFTLYELKEENEVSIDFNRPPKEDEAWWNITPLTYLDLSSNVLTSIPEQIGMFQDLTVLNLQDNNLTDLPQEIGNLTRLTKLYLNHNKLKKLPQELFKLTDLRHLAVSNNCLDSISKDISDLVMLEKLELSRNHLRKLPSGVGFLVRLTEFSISDNELSDLPPDIVNLRSLLKLDISHNSITKLPDMGELRKLQILYAQHNDIEEIPDFLGCEHVEEIYFGNNFIKDIPVEFCENMFHLKIFELRDNKIENIPLQITNLVHLTKLDLTNNDIKELPSTMGLMPHLQTFKVEGNKLKQLRPDIIRSGTNRILRHLRERISEEELEAMNVPTSDVFYDRKIFPDKYTMRNGNILNLTLKGLSEVPEECFTEAKEAKVTVVDFCKNKFTKVPTGLLHLSDYVTELNLSTNLLKEIPEFLQDFTKLKFCDLGKNSITNLPDSLSSMVNLRELVLSYNKLSHLPKCVYGMTGLEILLVNDNSIQEIDMNGLKNLNRLAVLDFTNNNISYVPPELGSMTQLRSLELKGNPFRQPRYAILEQGTESILSYLRDKIPT